MAGELQRGDLSPFARALERARASAYGPGGYVGQESFMTADEIRALAVAAGVGPGVRVLDVCCGPGGPAVSLARALGCDVLGVDASEHAVALARERARSAPPRPPGACRFEVAGVPPLPPGGPFDVVLLLETLLAFADKPALLAAIATALRPGGRLACTLEAGAPLTAAERAAMSLSHTVHLTPADTFRALLADAGLDVTAEEDHTTAHHDVAAQLAAAYATVDLPGPGGEATRAHLVASTRIWVDWLGSGRVRKLALVAERRPDRPRAD